jgi:hypothetical protein
MMGFGNDTPEFALSVGPLGEYVGMWRQMVSTADLR